MSNPRPSSVTDRRACRSPNSTSTRTVVAPGGKPQERVLTIAPFLARYGSGLLTELRDAFGAWYRSGLEAQSQPA
jgi:hypothetical protein